MRQVPIATSFEHKKHPTETMKALQWLGSTNVKVATIPRPMITDPSDAIVKITSTTICGSDLHLYHNEVEGMHSGDVMGHEFMGIVQEVGPAVKDLKPGDRVVVSAVIADGSCEYCRRGEFSLCDNTNPSKQMEMTYGHRTAGLFGYSHLTGGYYGGQAEMARVPFADVNCLKVPPSLSDDKVLFLSDIICTGWHANEMGMVGPGDVVAVWGCGPVGLMALALAKLRGASRIIAIDHVPERLNLAKNKLGAEIINFDERNVVEAIQQMVPGGPEVCIDCAGFRFSKSILHKIQRAVMLETDTPEILIECIQAVKKGGRVSIIGDYFKTCNNFPIGAMMEKGINVRGGQLWAQKYWKDLLGKIERGEFDPTFVITHKMPFEKAADAYRMFDKKEDGCIKVILSTGKIEE